MFRALPPAPPSFPVAPEFTAPASAPLKLSYVLEQVQVRCVCVRTSTCCLRAGSVQQAARSA